ncbi:MAG: hypothetical protein K2N87_16525 [Eubacterium sp.]|nr:hypothetical protein [Eubacterium sp.]
MKQVVLEKKKSIRTRISLCLERSLLRYLSARAKKRRPRRKCGKILVVRTDGLGDYILWLSVEQKIRELYKDKRMELLFDKRKPTPQLARYDCAADSLLSVHIVTWKRFLSVLRMYRRSYDVIIQPIYSRLAFTDLLVFAAKASERVTIDSNGQFFASRAEWEWSDRGYDRILPCQKGTRHELVRCAELARGLGVKNCLASLPDMSGILLPQVPELPDGTGRSYFMVFPSASWKGKVWESEKFAAVVQWMLETFDGVVYLCGDTQDVPVCDRIVRQVRPAGRKRLSVLAGRLNLAQLARMIQKAALVFGNDTGAVHLAAAYRVKAAAVVAEREIGRFFPYETQYPQQAAAFPVCVHQQGISCSGCLLRGEPVCRYRKHVTETVRCISSIQAEDVILVLRDLFMRIQT